MPGPSPPPAAADPERGVRWALSGSAALGGAGQGGLAVGRARLTAALPEEPPQGTAAWLCGQRLPKRLRVETTNLFCALEPLSSRSAEILLLRFAAACRDRAAWSGPSSPAGGSAG